MPKKIIAKKLDVKKNAASDVLYKKMVEHTGMPR